MMGSKIITLVNLSWVMLNTGTNDILPSDDILLSGDIQKQPSDDLDF